MNLPGTTRDLAGDVSPRRTELTRGNSYVLAIGIDQYQHHPPLYNCVKDLTDVVGILTLNYVFGRANVKELFNADATARNILVALDDFARIIGDTDSLVVLFSGHGHLRNDIGFWIPVDAREFTEYLNLSAVRDFLDPIKARHIFVIADACFAGRFFVPTTRRGLDPSEFLEKVSSRYALTSGRDEPASDGPRGENSPFAHALKYRLTTSSGPVGAVMLSEQVLQDVVQSLEGAQTPRHGEVNMKGNDHGQFFFHKKHAPTEKDVFIEVFFSKGGNLFPPGDRSRVQEHFDEYHRFFESQSVEEKARLRRLNTERYLARWGLSIAILKEKLKLLGFYDGGMDNSYAEALGDSIAAFQRHNMMRQIDGYFGELTYEKMAAALILSGLAKYPSHRSA